MKSQSLRPNSVLDDDFVHVDYYEQRREAFKASRESADLSKVTSKSTY